MEGSWAAGKALPACRGGGGGHLILGGAAGVGWLKNLGDVFWGMWALQSQVRLEGGVSCGRERGGGGREGDGMIRCDFRVSPLPARGGQASCSSFW